MLDENAVSLDQAVIVRRGVPAELFLEGRFGLVVAFDGGDAGQGADECLGAVDEPLGRGEAVCCMSMIGSAWRMTSAGGRGDGWIFCRGICGGLVGLFAGKRRSTGQPTICQPPDATKPALGGLCRFRIGGAGGN